MKRLNTKTGSGKRLPKTSILAEGALEVLLLREPISTLPLLVSRSLLSKAKSHRIRASYSLITKETAEAWLEWGIDPYDVVPCMLINEDQDAYEWARKHYPCLPMEKLLSRAADMGSFRYRPEEFNEFLDLVGIQRLIADDCLHLLGDTRLCGDAVAKGTRVGQLKPLEKLNKQRKAYDGELGKLLITAAELGRLDILMWAQNVEPPILFLGFIARKMLENAHPNFVDDTARWISRYPKIGVSLGDMLEANQSISLDLVKEVTQFDSKHAWKLERALSCAVNQGLVQIADWLLSLAPGEQPLASLKGLDFGCCFKEGFEWLEKHGWAACLDETHRVEFELQAAVIRGQRELVEELIVRVNLEKLKYRGPNHERHWHTVLSALIRLPNETCSMADKQAILGQLFPLFALEAGDLIEVAAEQNAADMVDFLRRHGGKTEPFWSAAIRAQSLACLQYAINANYPPPSDTLTRLYIPLRGEKLADTFTELLACSSDPIWDCMLTVLGRDRLADYVFSSSNDAERFRWIKKKGPLQLQSLQCTKPRI